MNSSWQIAGYGVGKGQPLLVCAGPCVLEDDDSTMELAERLSESTRRLGVSYIFKASFDKANRTSLGSFRGPGLERGKQLLAEVKQHFRVPVLTDVHEPSQADSVAEVADVLQIPAFLCRQTDLLLAAGRTGRPVNIKKGQFQAPGDMAYAVEKVASTGAPVLVTERGTSFGYHDLVVDMRSLVWLRSLGVPVLFDGTHSVQLPGAAGGASGGNREMIAPLCRAAAAVGIDGLYLEVHPQPERARCDGANSLTPAAFEALLQQVLEVRAALDE